MIDVRGYASVKGFKNVGDPKAKENDNLNWLLAEGRRVAALRSLGFASQATFLAPERGKQKDAPDPGHLELFAPLSPPTKQPVDAVWPARFPDYDSMHSSLEDWLDLTGDDQLPDAVRDGFTEAMMRSVVLAIKNDDLKSCRKLDPMVATTSGLPKAPL
jgi:hypothetical protein